MKAVRGFTLIELMIAMTIGLIVSLAAMTMLADSEGRRRTQASVASIDQSAQVAAYTLDDALRNAGSGFSQSWPYTFGCKLNAKASSTAIFPLPTLPAPFANVATAMGAYRLAPVIILKGQSQAGSDVLVIAEGTAGFGELPLSFGSAPTSSALNLVGTTTLLANDLVLVADRTGGGAPAACMLQQVSSTFTSGATVTQASLAGTYYSASGPDASLTSYSADGIAMSLGNASNSNAPLMSVIGVGWNDLASTAPTGSTLYSYNLLSSTSTPIALADGVVDLRALYGVDTDGDGKLDAWKAPDDASYTPSSLLDGSATSAQTIMRIKAIRIGMIVRTSLVEPLDPVSGAPVSPATLGLFSDLGTLAYTRNLSTAERNYRYRIVESTIPLRNLLLIAQ